MPNLTTEQKVLIIHHIQEGWSERNVAERLNIPKSTVHFFKATWQETNSLERRPGSGRPKQSNEEQDNNLVNVIRDQPFKSIVRAKMEINFPGSVRTARRRVREISDLRCHPAAKKPFLTEANKEQRIGFALQNYLEPPAFWEKVIFTDEKIFQSCYNGRLRVYRPPRTRFEEKFTQKDRNSGRFSVNVWGWMSSQGVGVCHFIEGRFNTEVYINILQNIMLPSVLGRFPERDFIYQQDNCPVHTARQAREWIENEQILILPWPARSPDLNVMENVWGVLVKKIHGENNFRPQNVEELKNKIEEAWNELNPDFTRALVTSMPRRLNYVLDKVGAALKY
jgi:transposase